MSTPQPQQKTVTNFANLISLVKAARDQKLTLDVLKTLIERDAVTVSNMDRAEILSKVSTVWSGTTVKPKVMPKRKSQEPSLQPAKEIRKSLEIDLGSEQEMLWIRNHTILVNL